ncbi:unnamed protein product [Closterium sp. Naga37s-1]|nr:unnamed protein product [Closterium sp. Naga37s-1]
MAGVVVVSSEDHWRSTLNGAKNDGKVVIVDFTATCFCFRILQNVAAECKVAAMPTFHVFKGGEKVDELVGASQEKLLKLIQKYAQ